MLIACFDMAIQGRVGDPYFYYLYTVHMPNVQLLFTKGKIKQYSLNHVKLEK